MPLDDRDWYRDALNEKQGRSRPTAVPDDRYRREMRKALGLPPERGHGNIVGYLIVGSLALGVALLFLLIFAR